ncbi:hypothetical protein B0H12DRAFT_359702 [Mycena haematopus]|nr:hypothetical protein B0H12DRAFT_359702 [Mycena haematopus]
MARIAQSRSTRSNLSPPHPAPRCSQIPHQRTLKFCGTTKVHFPDDIFPGLVRRRFKRENDWPIRLQLTSASLITYALKKSQSCCSSMCRLSILSETMY